MSNITKEQKNCHHCEGKGYLEIRDCTGEVQREETCVFCEGNGQIVDEEDYIDLYLMSKCHIFQDHICIVFLCEKNTARNLQS